MGLTVPPSFPLLETILVWSPTQCYHSHHMLPRFEGFYSKVIVFNFEIYIFYACCMLSILQTCFGHCVRIVNMPTSFRDILLYLSIVSLPQGLNLCMSWWFCLCLHVVRCCMCVGVCIHSWLSKSH